MAHYICRTITETPGYMQAQFKVPEGVQTYAGDIFLAETLDTDIEYGNWLTFEPGELDDITKEVPVIVLNGGFETLPDGRRPDGNNDWTSYAFESGEVFTAIRLLPELRLEISYDSIKNKNDIDGLGYLIPEVGSSSLRFVKTLSNVETKVYLKVEALKEFRLGGLFGGEFAKTLVARVKYNSKLAQPDPEITAIQANIVPGLQVGNDNVKSGATVLTMTAVGGTEPYTYALIPDGEVAQDNDKFVIGSAEVKVGANDLTEAKTYKIYVQATDSKGKVYKEGFDIPVAGA